MELFILLIVVICVCIIVCFSYLLATWIKYIRKQQIEKVKKASKVYYEILKLNTNFNFNNEILKQYCYCERCDSKREYDRIDLTELLMQRFENNLAGYKNVFDTINSNLALYKQYQNELQRVKTINKSTNTGGVKIKYNKFLQIESNLCGQIELRPICSTSFLSQASYLSPQGRKYYEKELLFTQSEMESIYQQTIKRIQEKAWFVQQVKNERLKMTDSLRYDILHRDNFKCQICGASASDGVKLHVDHIIPISKGGKTEMSNLRTLCDRCNFGKRDKIE